MTIWIISIVASLVISFCAWWAWTADWYNKLMCIVELAALVIVASMLAVLTVALVFTFEPLAFVIATICGILSYGSGVIAINIYERLQRL